MNIKEELFEYILFFCLIAIQPTYCQPCSNNDVTKTLDTITVLLANGENVQNEIYTCQTGGMFPESNTIKWYYGSNDTPLVQNSKYSISSDDFELTIQDIQPSDEGLYYCTFNNPPVNGTEQLCLLVRGYEELEDCGNNCSYTLTAGDSLSINVTFVVRNTGNSGDFAPVTDVFLISGSDSINVCRLNGINNFDLSGDDITSNCNNNNELFPNVSFLFSNFETNGTFKILSESENTPIVQSYIINIIVTPASVTPSSTTSITDDETSMMSFISTSPAVSINSITVTVSTISSTISDTMTSSLVTTSLSFTTSSTTQGQSSGNADPTVIGTVVGAVIFVFLVVIAIAIAILILFLHKQKYSLATKDYKLPELSTTFSREDRSINHELDDKPNSTPRFV